MKKGDVIIALSVFLAAVIMLFVISFGGDNGKTVKISRDNKVIHTAPLDSDNTFDIKTNLIEIKKGRVWVKSADCKNQICVNHKPISQKGEVIACLPNKVIIEIE